MMTQELTANRLGVRREGVTASAGKLQEARLIHYSRGRMTLLDRPRLEKRVRVLPGRQARVRASAPGKDRAVERAAE